MLNNAKARNAIQILKEEEIESASKVTFLSDAQDHDHHEHNKHQDHIREQPSDQFPLATRKTQNRNSPNSNQNRK